MKSERSCFICHASADFAVASRLVAELERRNWSCWIAPRNVVAGAHYPEQIVDALNDCDTLIILLSPAANKSKHVLRELEIAVHRSKNVIPVRIDHTEPTASMCYLLASLQWIDVSKQELLADVGALASKIISGVGTPQNRSNRKKRIAAVVCCALLMAGIPFLMAVSGNGSAKAKHESGPSHNSGPEHWLPHTYLDDIISIRRSIQDQWQSAMNDGGHDIMFAANATAYEKLKRIAQQIATAAYPNKEIGTRSAAEIFGDRLDAMAHSGSRRLAESRNDHGSGERPIADAEKIQVAHDYIAELVKGATPGSVYDQWIVRWNAASE